MPAIVNARKLPALGDHTDHPWPSPDRGRKLFRIFSSCCEEPLSSLRNLFLVSSRYILPSKDLPHFPYVPPNISILVLTADQSHTVYFLIIINIEIFGWLGFLRLHHCYNFGGAKDIRFVIDCFKEKNSPSPPPGAETCLILCNFIGFLPRKLGNNYSDGFFKLRLRTNVL